MKRKLRTSLFAAAVALGASSAVLAQQQTGFYVGGSVGQAKAKEWCDTSGTTGFTVSSCDDKDTAWKLFAGYRFHPNFAGEATYAQLGNFTARGTFSGSPFDVNTDGNAFGLAALGIWPVSPQFDLFGKLGFLRTEAEATVTVGGGTVKLGENETEAHYGLGATYNFSRNWGLRGEWERADKSKLDMWSIGVQYKF